MSFETRTRYTEEEARSVLTRSASVIRHLLKNDDGTFSIMSHIVCEWCDYCEEQGDCRGRKDVEPVRAKAAPYEIQQQNESLFFLEELNECKKELIRCRWAALEMCEDGGVRKLEELLGKNSKEIEQDMRRLIEYQAERDNPK